MLSYLRAPLAALRSHQLLLDTVAHNLSNVNTNGFRRLHAEFADVIYRQLQPVQDQPPTARNLSGGVLPEATPRSYSLGHFAVTGNPMDMALNGEGFFQVLLPDGRVAYTRDGAFGVDALGRLVTAAGHPLLPEVQIPEDAARFYVYPNGAVYIQAGPDDTPGAWQQVGQLQVATFPNPQGLVAEGGNVFTATPAAGAPIVGLPGDLLPGEPNARFGEVLFATLESSNVDMTVETTTLLMAHRAYSISARTLQAIDEMLSGAVNLRRG
jgi:flagellar basal-body rod protein FlgG